MKHIVLTGATGFLGSHLLGALLAQNYKVTILKRSTSDTWRVKRKLEQVSVFDVDKAAIEEAFKGDEVDAVIHTACSYGRNGESIAGIIESNLLLGLRLVELAEKYQIRQFINTDTLLPPNVSDYALSKSQYLAWIKSNRWSINIVNMKIEHMFGPDDDISKFIPWLFSQFDRRVKRVPLTRGTQTRDFIYVDDVIEAYCLVLRCADQMIGFQEFEVGSGESIQLRRVVEIAFERYQNLFPDFCCQLGFGDVQMRANEPMALEVDTAALNGLGWSHAISLQEGLDQILRERK